MLKDYLIEYMSIQEIQNRLKQIKVIVDNENSHFNSGLTRSKYVSRFLPELNKVLQELSSQNEKELYEQVSNLVSLIREEINKDIKKEQEELKKEHIILHDNLTLVLENLSIEELERLKEILEKRISDIDTDNIYADRTSYHYEDYKKSIKDKITTINLVINKIKSAVSKESTILDEVVLQRKIKKATTLNLKDRKKELTNILSSINDYLTSINNSLNAVLNTPDSDIKAAINSSLNKRRNIYIEYKRIVSGLINSTDVLKNEHDRRSLDNLSIIVTDEVIRINKHKPVEIRSLKTNARYTGLLKSIDKKKNKFLLYDMSVLNRFGGVQNSKLESRFFDIDEYVIAKFL